MSQENKSKYAEETLDRLEYLIKNEFKPNLEAAKKVSKDPYSEAFQKRAATIVDLERVYESCRDMLKEHIVVLNDNSRFIEFMRNNVLLDKDVMPKELFSEQADMVTEALKPLTKRYEDTVRDYYIRKKGE